MDILEKPYYDFNFVANIKNEDLNLILDCIDNIPNINEDDVCISYGVSYNGKADQKTLSIWVCSDLDSTVFRNQIYQSMLRLQSTYYQERGEIFDKNNVWYPIFREANLMGVEWYEILKAVVTKFRMGEGSYEDCHEYIVADDLFERYKDILENNKNNLYSLELNREPNWADKGETGWVLMDTGMRVSYADNTRICLSGDIEDYSNTETMLDTLCIYG